MLLTAIWTLPCILATAAFPASPPNPRACTNHLSNPSFESSALDPWLPIVQSAWDPARGVYPGPTPPNGGSYSYFAHATSTIDAALALGQSGLDVVVGSSVDCYAWVAGKRGEGVTSVTVFLDGVVCGSVELGAGDEGWKRVGSRVVVLGGTPGWGSSMAVVASSKSAGDDGWDIRIDEAGVVSC